MARYGAIARLRNLAAAVLIAVGPAAAEPFTVAALGDSLVQGYGLAPEAGLVPQLQGWLDGHGLDVRLINAGVSGDTTQGGLSRIGWTLTDEIDGVIVFLGGNDMLRGIDPGLVRANLDGILSAIADRGLPALLIGIAAPGNYGPDYKAEFEAIFPDLAATHGVPLYPNFFAAIVENGQARTGLLQPDATHPNAEGVARIVADLGPHVAKWIAKRP